MSTPMTINLGKLPSLGDIFNRLNNGRHLNRLAEPRLWAELIDERDAYESLFAALGYALRIDERGFAWFHFDTGTPNVSKNTRQLALLFMMLFEYQADHGQNLQRFTDWLVDNIMLSNIVTKNGTLLQAEDMGDGESLTKLMGVASSYCFATQETAGWRLLPAVCRYLDRFEELARGEEVDNLSADSDSDTCPDMDREDES